MDKDHKTVYGTLNITYDKTAVIGMDEYYIILATEVDSNNSVITVTIYGVNTYDSSITDKIVDANGEYVLPEKETETTTQESQD